MQSIALGVIKNEAKQVLLIKRATADISSDNELLLWAFPGGTVEPNETPEKAVVREVLEETGYSVKEIKLISQRQHPQFPVFVYYFACKVKSTDAIDRKPNDEIASVQWIDISQLTQYLTTNIDPQVLAYVNN